MTRKVLLTGVTGFIGRAVLHRLSQDDKCSLIAAVRSHDVALPVCVSAIKVAGLDRTTNWTTALADVDSVVHCAALVDVALEQASNPLAALHNVNVEGTLTLASQAANAGVKRFVFISSIKVNGECSTPGQSLRAEDKPSPLDSYGTSKLEAEQGLLEMAMHTDMEMVIIRPPLVYGPRVKGNFAALIRCVRKGVPLPLGAVQNRRSLVALDNLVDFIELCANRDKSPKAANQIFLVSDGEDVSTPELLNKIGRAYGRKVRLLPVPVSWMRWAARILGKEAIADRLFGSLVVDSSKARDLLGWKPVITMDEQLCKMARYDQSA